MGFEHMPMKRKVLIQIGFLIFLTFMFTWNYVNDSEDRALRVHLLREGCDWAEAKRAEIEEVGESIYKTTVNGQEQFWFVNSYAYRFWCFADIYPYTAELECGRFTAQLSEREMMAECMRRDLRSADEEAVLNEYKNMPTETLRYRYYTYFCDSILPT